MASPLYSDNLGIATVTFDVISSTLTTALVNKLLVVGEGVVVEDVIVETDATGLAGATLFQVRKTDPIGINIIFSQAVSGLGANITFDLSTATIKNRSQCVGGTYIGVIGTVDAGTGAGVARVTVRYRRLNANSTLQLV